MNERTEQQIEKDKEAIASMQRAQANMTKALDRIHALEHGLAAAASGFADLKRFIGPGCYIYDSRTTVTACFDEHEAAARKLL